MANVAVSGHATFTSGEAVPLSASAHPEGTLTELLTDASFTVVAQSLGTYAPGKVVTALNVGAQNAGGIVYILRRGLPILFGYCTKSGVVSYGNKMAAKTVSLEPGDQVMVLCNTAADRECFFVVHCASGVERAFSVTPGAGGTFSLLDTITSQKIGNVLQGQRITHAYAMSVDGHLITSGGVVIINAKGSVVGVCATGDSIETMQCYSPFNASIGLNFDAQIMTSA